MHVLPITLKGPGRTPEFIETVRFTRIPELPEVFSTSATKHNIKLSEYIYSDLYRI